MSSEATPVAKPKVARRSLPRAEAIAAKVEARDMAKPMTRNQLVENLAVARNITKKEATRTIQWLGMMIEGELSPSGPGVITIPGLATFKAVRKPATAAKSGVNPFTKAPMVIAAKPARSVVKVKPAKALRDAVGG